MSLTFTRKDLPKAAPVRLSKGDLLSQLAQLDDDPVARRRILDLEAALRARMGAHLSALPAQSAPLARFNTSPFVLMTHCLSRQYTKVSQIEGDILPAKQFSSMETSAGRMVEEVTLPTFGWEIVESGMHTAFSALDGRRVDGDTLHVATLKSGPRCLNDEMSENLADAILSHSQTWAEEADRRQVEFTYGVLYGTPRLSNKKDWHILRNVVTKLDGGRVHLSPAGQWRCIFERDGITVTVSVRIGLDWWAHLGRDASTSLQLCVALVRACVRPGDADDPHHPYTISDFGQIVSLSAAPPGYNVALLQRSQLPWLFFLARHFCDELI